MRISSSSLTNVGLLVAVILVLSSSVSAHFEVHPLSKIAVDQIRIDQTSGGSITIDALVLNGTGNPVNISWSNVGSPYPGNNDWIGVWSPRLSDYTKTTPVKYKYVVSDSTGSGSTEFWLKNMRHSFSVAYFTGGFNTPTLLADSQSSPVASPLGITVPFTIKRRITQSHHGDVDYHSQLSSVTSPTSSPPVIPLTHSLLWHAALSVGTPPQLFEIEMDTGWDQLVLPTVFSPPPYPYPSSTYDVYNSSTATLLTCDAAHKQGIKCDSCDGPLNGCTTNNWGIFDHPFQWACDEISFDGVTLFPYCFSLLNQTEFIGDFGIKIDAPNVPGQPTTNQLLPTLQKLGIIDSPTWSICVNTTSETGLMQFGRPLAPEDGVITSAPTQWMSKNVTRCWIGDEEIYDSTAPDSTPAYGGVDTGTWPVRLPQSWVTSMITYLQGECSTNPLVGMCPTLEYPDVTNTSNIFAGTCFVLTDEQISAYPTIHWEFAPLDGSNTTEPIIISHPPQSYIFSSSFLFDGLPQLVNCSSVKNAFAADFGLIAEDVNQEYVILGETFYQNWLVTLEYESFALGLAPIQQCGE